MVDQLRWQIEFRESQYALRAARMKNQVLSFESLKVTTLETKSSADVHSNPASTLDKGLNERRLVCWHSLASLLDLLRLVIQSLSRFNLGHLVALRLR